VSVLTHTIFFPAFVLIQKQTKIKAGSFGKYRFRKKRLKMKYTLRVDRHSSGQRAPNSLRKAVHLIFQPIKSMVFICTPRAKNAASGEAA